MTVHRLTSAPGRGVTVVRPDGYIGFRSRTAEADQLAAWLARVSAAGGFAITPVRAGRGPASRRPRR